MRPGVAPDSTQLPNGFHDAVLIEVHLDLADQLVGLTFDFSTGDPNAPEEAGREASRRGVLRLIGVRSIQIEPPNHIDKLSTDGGVLVDGDFGAYPGTPAPPEDGQIRLWLFVQTWNSRMLFTAASCDLMWSP